MRFLHRATPAAAAAATAAAAGPPIRRLVSAASRVSDAYGALCETALTADPAQRRAAEALDGVVRRAAQYAAARRVLGAAAHLAAPGDAPAQAALVRRHARTPRGLYLWGGVGTGKSMLMDLAYEAARHSAVAVPSASDVLERLAAMRALDVAAAAAAASAAAAAPAAPAPPSEHSADADGERAAVAAALHAAAPRPLPVLRVHFHAFMLDVHARVHAWKQQALVTHGRSRHIDVRPERDAIVQVSKALAAEASLLCFDEFQVTDVADAMIMSRVFGTLLAEGCVLVATSNRPPGKLYQDGLNREYFLPFLRQLDAHVKVHHLDVPSDYRLRGAHRAAEAAAAAAEAAGTSAPCLLFVPAGSSATAAALATIASVEDGQAPCREPPPLPESLPWSAVPVMMGRTARVRSPAPGVALATFDELCAQPLGAADYAAICTHFHTLVLLDVPRQLRSKHNEARRLITLVDELYEHRVQLVLTAAAGPAELFEPLLRAASEAPVVAPDAPLEGGAAASRPLQAAGAASPSGASSHASRLQPHVLHAVRAHRAREAGGPDELPALASLPFSESDYHVRHLDPAFTSGVVSEVERAATSELAFATRRAVSRLVEMTSPHYRSSAATAAVRQRLDKAHLSGGHA